MLFPHIWSDRRVWWNVIVWRFNVEFKYLPLKNQFKFCWSESKLYLILFFFFLPPCLVYILWIFICLKAYKWVCQRGCSCLSLQFKLSDCRDCIESSVFLLSVRFSLVSLSQLALCSEENNSPEWANTTTWLIDGEQPSAQQVLR